MLSYNDDLYKLSTVECIDKTLTVTYISFSVNIRMVYDVLDAVAGWLHDEITNRAYQAP